MSAQVRPGYKLTEVGVIPENWSVKPLGQLTGKITTGKLDANAMVEDGAYPFFTCARDVYKINDYAFDTEALLVSGNGANVGYIHYYYGKFNAYQRTYVLSGFSADITYLKMYMGQKLQERLRTEVNAGNTPYIVMGTLTEMQIGLPSSIDEQRAIAIALSDMDTMISRLDQLISKKRDIKQATMQQLLTGQKRLPGFSGEWEVKTLFEIAQRKKELFDDGDWIESEHITNQGVRLIQTGNIGIGRFIEKDVRKYIFEKSFTSLRCKELRHGDLLLCRLADPAGRACVLPDIGEDKIVTSVDVTIFRAPTDTIDRVFLSNLFSTPEWFRAVSDRSGGTTHKRISRGALGRISIKIPEVQEQSAIATILSDMDSELTALETRRDKARQLKRGMMQELLTGRIRLSQSSQDAKLC